jgi:hypothetical protein
MDRLANLENGSTAKSLRQIYQACVNSSLDYSSPVWWKPGRSITALDAIQGKAARRILGVFRTAPALPVALEAGLPPPTVRLERLSTLYGLRVRDLPHNHPVPEALAKTILPRKTRPLSNRVEIPEPKRTTQLQVIKRRQKQYSGLSKEEATKLLRNERTGRGNWSSRKLRLKADDEWETTSNVSSGNRTTLFKLTAKGQYQAHTTC